MIVQSDRQLRHCIGVVPLLLVVAAALLLAAPARGQTEPPKPSPCASADALKKVGETEEAKKAYLEVLKSGSGSNCAPEGLEELKATEPPPAAEDCARGNTYLELDRNGAATKAFEAGLEKNPHSHCAKHGLEKAGPSGVTGAIYEIVQFLPTLVEAAVLLVLALFAVLMVGYLRPVGRLMRGVPGIRHIVSPRLKIEILEGEIEDKPGAAIAAGIKERLWRMRDEAVSRTAPGYDLDFGTPRDEFADLVSDNGGLKSALENASEVSEQTKVVAAVINLVYWALPIKRFSLSGCLEPSNEAGEPGATLLLEKNSKLEGAATLRSPNPTAATLTAADYMRLVDPSAVWLQYEVTRVLRGRDADPEKAESYALLREGLDCYALKSLEEARSCYERAILLNRRNWAAYVSLAVVEARLGDDFKRSVEKAKDGFERMQRPPERRRPWWQRWLKIEWAR